MCLRVHVVKRKLTAPIHENLNAFCCAIALMRGQVPEGLRDTLLLHLWWRTNTVCAWLCRAMEAAAEIGITVMHLHWHTMDSCVGFPFALWWYFQLPRFILPLLNGNNDIQLFYPFYLSCETGGWWCISWRHIWQWLPKNLLWVFLLDRW